MKDSSYTHYSGGVGTPQSGWLAIDQALIDGQTAGSAALTSSSQGIVAENQVNGNPLGLGNVTQPSGYFAIGSANSTQLGSQTTWGGIPLTGGTNQCVLRETYKGDANMQGAVTFIDYTIWANGYSYPLTHPDSWTNGDFNYGGAVTFVNYTIWANSYSKGLASIGGSAGPVQLSSGPSAVPEPGTLALFLAGAVGLAACGLRKLRNKNFTTHVFQFSKGSSFMKKCLLVVAAIAALAAATTARADLIDTYLVPDGVYTSQAAYQDWLNTQSSTDILSTATITGQTVNLQAGTTSAYISMAIVATVNNGTSGAPLSSDGIAWAALNLVGTTTGNLGTGNLQNPTGAGAGALVNGGALVGNQNGAANPGANSGSFGAGLSYWQTLAASPVQAYAGTSTKSSSNGWYNKPIEWQENFSATGSQAGVNMAPMTIGVAGSAAESTSDAAHNFVAIYSPPSVPAGDRLVTYSSPTAFTVGSTTAANGTAIPPGSGASAFLLGASGISATSATFVLGEVDYNFTGAGQRGWNHDPCRKSRQPVGDQWRFESELPGQRHRRSIGLSDGHLRHDGPDHDRRFQPG